MSRKNFNAFIKKQKAEKKRKAKQEKKLRREARKNQPTSGNLEDMMAYLDEDGNIISVESNTDDSEPTEKDDSSSKEKS